jgi:hypothetical protein
MTSETGILNGHFAHHGMIDHHLVDGSLVGNDYRGIIPGHQPIGARGDFFHFSGLVSRRDPVASTKWFVPENEKAGDNIVERMRIRPPQAIISSMLDKVAEGRFYLGLQGIHCLSPPGDQDSTVWAAMLTKIEWRIEFGFESQDLHLWVGTTNLTVRRGNLSNRDCNILRHFCC